METFSNTPKRKRKKKPIEEIEDPSFEEMHTKILRCPQPIRAYLCLVWLTGNRVSEILGIPARKITGEYTYIRPTRKNPYRIVKVKKYKRMTEEEIMEAGIEAWEVRPVRKWDIEISPDKPIIRVNTRTLKQQGRPRHKYIARIDRPEEAEMWKIATEYISSRDPEEPLFPYTRQYAWLLCDRYLGIPPHKLRGLRATRDAVEYHLDSIDLKEKYNWSSPAMPLHYAKKDTRKLEEKLLKEK